GGGLLRLLAPNWPARQCRLRS
ncbi:tail fiber protein, partial [Achromobacter phage kwar_LB4]